MLPLSRYLNLDNIPFVNLAQEQIDALGIVNIRLELEGDDLESEVSQIEYYDEDYEEEVSLTWSIGSSNKRTYIVFELNVASEIIITVPNFNDVQLVISPTGADNFNIKLCSYGNNIYASAGISFILKFSDNLLKPAQRTVSGERVSFQTIEEGPNIAISVGRVSVGVDLVEGFYFRTSGYFGLPESTDYNTVKIGDTNIYLSDFRLALNIDGKGLKPENAPDTWKGVIFESLKLYFPDIFQGSINARNLGVGENGIYGIIEYRADPPLSYNESTKEFTGDRTLFGELLGIKGGIDLFNLHFTENIPSQSEISGKLLLPFFEKLVVISINISAVDGFQVELAGQGTSSLLSLEKEGLLKLDISSIKFESLPNFTVILAGSLRMLLGGLNWPTLQVNKLSIDSKGEVVFDGGWLNLPTALTLDFKGFKMSLSQFGLGSEEKDSRPRQWLGVSGSIQLSEGIPIKGSVEGLKFSWIKDTPGHDLQVSLRGIGVELKIPGTLELVGSVSYHEAEPDAPANSFTGFKGHVKLNLIALKTEIEGTLMIGKSKDAAGREFTVFYIQLSATLPAAIPMGGTGTGLYYIEGLFGMNVAPTKTEQQKWYDWYVADPPRDMTGLAKWQPMNDNLAFGVGVKIGTMPDDGTTLNLGAMLVVLIPGPVIMLEGRANLLKQRSDDNEEDGAFYLLAVLDGRAGTFQLNIDVRYNLQDIVEIGGGLEAFFDFNDDTKWYIYIGRKEPVSKRLQAKILKNLFTANTYFMIDPKALQLGASVGVNINETYGPVVLRIIAGISMDAAIFFKPFQMTGELRMIADLAVTVFGIGLRLLLEALLGGKVPEPYLVYGKARVAFQLFWPLPSFNFEVEFRWEQAADTPAVSPLFKVLEAKTEADPVRKAAYMKHHKSSDVNIELFYKAGDAISSEELAQLPYVPVDARPVLTFAKTLHQIGDIDLGEQPDVVGNGSFRYQLDNLILCESSDGSNWTEVKSGIDTITTNEATSPNPARFQFYKPAETCSIVNGADAKEPIIELWRTSILDRNNSYQNEQTESPCRPTQMEVQNLNWYDEPSSQQALPAIFQHQGAWIISQQGYEPGGPVFTRENTFSIDDKGQIQEPSQNAGPVNNLPRVDTYTIPSANPKEKKTLQALRARNATIVFPEDVIMATVVVMFDWTEANDFGHIRLKAVGNDGANIPASPLSNQGNIVSNGYFLIDVQTPRPFRYLQIEENESVDKAFWLLNIMYITQTHFQALMFQGYDVRTILFGALTQSNPSLPPAPRTVQPTQPLVLKPNKFYRLEVLTSAKNHNNAAYAKGDYLFFRTDKGPGILTLAPSKENDEIFKHKDNPVNKLSTYISDTFPLHGASNHYFSEKLKISFNEQYVLKLYDSSTLHLRIRDRNGKYIGGNTWTNASWPNSERPLLLHGLRAYLRALGRGGCGTPTPAVMEPRADFALPSGMTPNTLYFAEIAIKEGEEYKVVHDLSFTTSRYASFKQHLEDVSTKVRTIGRVSLLPSDGALNQIQYLIENGLEGYRNNITAYRGLFGTHPPTDYLRTINQYEGVVNNKKSWEEQAATLFDNLYNNHIEKAFKFSILAPDGSEHEVDMTQRGLPNQLEFIKIPLGTSGQFLLLVESPEPIDWIHVSGTITAGGSNHSVNAVPSRDKTRALLSVGSLIYHSFEGTMSFDLDYAPFTGLGDGFDVGSATADQRKAIFTITSGMSQTIQRAGMALTARESISSPNGNYQLTLRTNGNLELMGYGITLWQSKTAGQPGARLTLQEDGNLVIYNRENIAIWSSDTWGSVFAGTTLRLGDDGNLSLVHPQGQIVWETRTANGFTPKDKLQPGVTLSPNQSLYSNNRQFRLTYQADGNLVQYRNRDNQALWASGTHGQASGRFELKADGVLAIYDPNNTILWAARYTGDQGLGSRLQLSDAGAVNILTADGRVLQSIEHLEIASPKPENIIAFRHTVTTRNVPTATPHLTIIDHPQLNENPSAILFVTPVWGNTSSGVENPNVCGVWYREGRWVILNQSPSTPMLLGSSFQVMATAAENPHVFVHTATAASLSMNRTYIDHPASNNRPNALLMVTQHYGEYNNREVAVAYNHSGNQWFIYNKVGWGGDSYNESLNGIPLYAKFNVLVTDGDNVPGIRAFAHQATDNNIMPAGGQKSFLDHAVLNNNPDAKLFFTESWLSHLNGQALSTGGVPNQSTAFLWYDDPADQYHHKDNYWALHNSGGHPMERGRMFNIFVLEEQAGLLPVQAAPNYDEGLTFVAYRHLVGTSFNPTVQSTILDHPLLNNNPAAVVFANSNWGYRGTGLDNSNLFGVRYNGSRWEIANQSGRPNTMNPAFSFNVLIAPQNCPNVFIHQATKESLQSNRSFLDHPLVNGKPDVHLMVTQHLSDGRANNHEIGVAYTNGRWFVYNNVGTLGDEANIAIPEGAKFNVLVLSGSENSNLEIFTHQAVGKNIIPSGQNITFVTHPKLDHQRDAMVFATLAWLPTGGGAYNPSMIALWYDDEADGWKYKERFWSIYNTFQGVPMAWGAAFNVFVLK